MESDLPLTTHAAARMQQRGIRPAALEALLDFGRVHHLEDGCDIVFFDKKAKRRLAKANPAALRDAARLCRTYAIVASDSSVITVGHRYRRIPRP
jgi:hypothetical protein